MRRIRMIAFCICISILMTGCSKYIGVSKDTADYSSSNVALNPIIQKTLEDQEDNSDSLSEGDDTGPNNTEGIPLTIQEVKPIITGFATVKNNKFQIKIPEGWKIETTGEYETLGFRAYDPENPERQIFYYGKMDPFLKSEESKDFYKESALYGGSSYQLYADAPVLNPGTTEEYFYKFNDFAEFAAYYGIDHNFPVFNNLEFVESFDRNSPFASYVTDEKILRGFFDQSGVYCEGQFAASVYDAITYNANGIDTGFYYVYMIAGVTAPADEFPMLQSQLVESLSSFEYTQDCINKGVSANQTETEQIINMGKAIQDTYDSYNAAWENRQQSYDALSQKQSDATLGYTRVLDTESGEVYRAENGFYNEYQQNPYAYTNPNLKAIEEDDYTNYLKGITGYIIK